MANQEHFDLLKQGSSAWNAWRQEQQEKVILRRTAKYLEEIDSSDYDDDEQNLSGTSHNQAAFPSILNDNVRKNDDRPTEVGYFEVDLSNADLSNVNLSIDVYYSEADMHRVLDKEISRIEYSRTLIDILVNDLYAVNNEGYNLSNANLSNANLRFTDLTRANLTRADLSNAKQL